MKRNKSTGISQLFAKYYLAFTIALVLIFGGIYFLWNEYYSSLLTVQNVDALVNSKAFQEGDYEDINPSKYLGVSSAFAILDDNCNVIYSSNSSIPEISDTDTLLCIPEYDSDIFYESISLQTEAGENRIVITEEKYSGDGTSKKNAVILNEDGEVIEGKLDTNKTYYTQEEIGYLTGSWSKEYTLERYSFVDSDNSNLTLLVLLPQFTDSQIRNATTSAARIWLLIIPAYLLITFVFVVLLNRCFKQPLERLKESIIQLGLGKNTTIREYSGPKEIQEIGDSFNEMANKLESSKEETKRLEEQRTKMLADISHDLKTPITVISGYINAMKDGKIAEAEMPQYMETISGKVDSLTELINSFHEYSKTEHPDFKLNLESVDICEFLREYLADKFDEIDHAGFLLDVKIPEESIKCQIDKFQIKRALDNILNNAIKYNRLGTVITVSLTKENEHILLRIADNGVGISKEIKDDLFSPFVVGNPSRTKSGSGLGLSIAKRIINAHGWDIHLIDTKNVGGTTYEIEINQ